MYKPSKKKLPPIEFEFDVLSDEGTLEHIKATGRHLFGYQFAALDDLTIGVVKDEADPTGKLLAERYGLKLGNVLTACDGVDPEALNGGDWAAFCTMAGNEEFAFRGWTAYCVALGSAYTKSPTTNGDADSDGGERREAAQPTPQAASV